MRFIFTFIIFVAYTLFFSPNTICLASDSEIIPISNWHELQGIKYNLKGNYELVNDLDEYSPGYDCYRENIGFEPIGKGNALTNPEEAFQGTFDGNCFTIKNLYINRPTEKRIGLFGSVHQGSIKNIHLENVTIIGGGAVGALVGTITNSNEQQGKVLIENASVSGTVKAVGKTAGGLAGCLHQTGIKDCASVVEVKGTSFVGGLCGNATFATIQNSYASGAITAFKDWAGGLSGIAYGNASHPITVKDCFAGITIHCRGDNVAGLVCRDANTLASPLNVNNCYHTFKEGNGPGAFVENLAINSDHTQHPAFAKWNFQTVWKWASGEEFPVLACYN